MAKKHRGNFRDLEQELEDAILASDLGRIDEVLNCGADINFSKEVFEIKGPHYLVLSYPLWLAIESRVDNLEEVVSYLLEKGAKPSDYKTYELASKGSTLIKACELSGQKRNRIVSLLLEAGASPKEGKGAVGSHIDWSLGSRQENQELKELLGLDGLGKNPRAAKSKKSAESPSL